MVLQTVKCFSSEEISNQEPFFVMQEGQIIDNIHISNSTSSNSFHQRSLGWIQWLQE